MKTIKQIADEIGVSKQAVHKKMKKEPLATTLQKFITTVDGIIYIEVDGGDLIKSTFSKKEPSTKKENNHELSTTTNELTPTGDGTTVDYISALKEQISALTNDKTALQEQLKEEKEYSRAQIADLQNELTKEREHSRQQAEKLADITRNSQILLKQEQDKTAYLLPDETQGGSDSSGEGEGKKRGFWRFWKK